MKRRVLAILIGTACLLSACNESYEVGKYEVKTVYKKWTQKLKQLTDAVNKSETVAQAHGIVNECVSGYRLFRMEIDGIMKERKLSTNDRNDIFGSLREETVDYIKASSDFGGAIQGVTNRFAADTNGIISLLTAYSNLRSK